MNYERPSLPSVTVSLTAHAKTTPEISPNDT